MKARGSAKRRQRTENKPKPQSVGDQKVEEPPLCATAPIIRDAIIQAAVEAGGGDMVAYLKKQAETHPSAFLTLLGKVLPMQLTGGKGEPVNLEFSVRFIAAEQENGDESRRS